MHTVRSVKETLTHPTLTAISRPSPYNLKTQSLNPLRNSAFLCPVADHRTIQKDGATLDILEADGLRLTINRLGAEMVSIARQDSSGQWHGFLYRDGEIAPPSSGWANHATVMGYFLHRLWKEQSTYRSHTIHGGNHGFLRHFQFAEPSQESDSLTYRVPAEQVPPAAYPLKVSLALTYSIKNAGVCVEFSFQNHEPDLEAHVSFGLHPGFSVTNLSTAKIFFPAGTYVRQFAPGNFLNGQTGEIPHAGGEMPLSKEKLPDSYILDLAKVPSRIFTIEDPESARKVDLDFTDCPYITLWSDAPNFICLEPCWGLPDSNPPVPFEQKAGIQHIPAGETLSRTFTITPMLLS